MHMSVVVLSMFKYQYQCSDLTTLDSDIRKSVHYSEVNKPIL